MDNYSYFYHNCYPEYKFKIKTSHKCGWYKILEYVNNNPNCTRAQWKKDINLDRCYHTSYGHSPWTALKKAGYIVETTKYHYTITQLGINKL